MRDGSLRHVDREIDWRKRVCGTVREKKKKKNEKEIHHWHESFLLHDSIGRSHLFRFSFCFILFYLIVIFFFVSYQTYMDDKDTYIHV